jgi:hypothetical protein
MKTSISVTALMLMAVSSGAANAQDPGAAPAYGSMHLIAGFPTDPTSVAVQAGGAVSTSSVVEYCPGLVTPQPSYNLDYEAGNRELFLSAASDADAMLLVRAPDGSWHCDDDGSGQNLNPGLTFSQPLSGVYNIWVGAVGYGVGYEPAMLHISELGYSDENMYARPPNPMLNPNSGHLILNAGFDEDPRVLEVQAGGDIDAVRQTNGQCAGFISEAPDAWVNYSASDAYELYFSMQSDNDTTLVIKDPDGDWVCDDDSAGFLNPGIRIRRPQSGRYAVWAGRFNDGPTSPAELYVSELGFAGIEDMAADLNPAAPSSFGRSELVSGFDPDPMTVSLQAGGPVDVFEAVGQECRGFAAAAPDYRLDYQAGNLDLYISASSDSDATLIVYGPDGNWMCDDDGAEGLNPGLHMDSPLSGTYLIWVGTYNPGGFAPSALHISELGFGGAFEPQNSLEPESPAIYGDVALAAGFQDDPYVIQLQAGGTQAAEFSSASYCRGFVSSAPDFRVEYEAGDEDLYVSVLSEVDTTLVVLKPDGSWACDDDRRDFNPGLRLEEPDAGTYHIWVGTYVQGSAGSAARLSVSESGFHFQ